MASDDKTLTFALNEPDFMGCLSTEIDQIRSHFANIFKLPASGSSHELVSDLSRSQDSKTDLVIALMITKFDQASYENIHYNKPHNYYLNKQVLSLSAPHNYRKMGSVHNPIINNKSISRRSHHTKTYPQQPNN